MRTPRKYIAAGITVLAIGAGTASVALASSDDSARDTTTPAAGTPAATSTPSARETVHRQRGRNKAGKHARHHARHHSSATDDHGRHEAEPGDDRGREAEAGDDRGNHAENEVEDHGGDDSGHGGNRGPG
jgi:hypothetical protein